jgi:hypothetical protein
MNNLHIRKVIEDQCGHVQFHVYGHGAFSEDHLHRLLNKRSLWEPRGSKTIYGKPYQIINIMAGDGWEDAP